MAKGGRGGKRTASGGSSTVGVAAKTQQQAQQQTQVDDTQVAQAMSANYDKFMAMSDDDKADVIKSAISQDVPDHLSNSDFQKFIYNTQMNDKPQLVDDGTLDGMNGTELFRTVNNVYDSNNDISYTADQIARQVQAGKITRCSDNGGSAYGRGIYFASTYGSSSGYGNANGNVKKTAVIRCKLNSNAKVITSHKASAGAQSEISKGTKLGKTLQKCDRASQWSIYALAKGYNVLSDGSDDYYCILNRNAVTMSSSIKPKSNRGW